MASIPPHLKRLLALLSAVLVSAVYLSGTLPGIVIFNSFQSASKLIFGPPTVDQRSGAGVAIIGMDLVQCQTSIRTDLGCVAEVVEIAKDLAVPGVMVDVALPQTAKTGDDWNVATDRRFADVVAQSRSLKVVLPQMLTPLGRKGAERVSPVMTDFHDLPNALWASPKFLGVEGRSDRFFEAIETAAGGQVLHMAYLGASLLSPATGQPLAIADFDLVPGRLIPVDFSNTLGSATRGADAAIVELDAKSLRNPDIQAIAAGRLWIVTLNGASGYDTHQTSSGNSIRGTEMLAHAVLTALERQALTLPATVIRLIVLSLAVLSFGVLYWVGYRIVRQGLDVLVYLLGFPIISMGVYSIATFIGVAAWLVRDIVIEALAAGLLMFIVFNVMRFALHMINRWVVPGRFWALALIGMLGVKAMPGQAQAEPVTITHIEPADAIVMIGAPGRYTFAGRVGEEVLDTECLLFESMAVTVTLSDGTVVDRRGGSVVDTVTGCVGRSPETTVFARMLERLGWARRLTSKDALRMDANHCDAVPVYPGFSVPLLGRTTQQRIAPGDVELPVVFRAPERVIEFQVIVYDSAGRVVVQSTTNSPQVKLPAATYEPGRYRVEIASATLQTGFDLEVGDLPVPPEAVGNDPLARLIWLAGQQGGLFHLQVLHEIVQMQDRSEGMRVLARALQRGILLDADDARLAQCMSQ